MQDIQAKLQHLNCDSIHLVWVKYFLKTRELPKDFLKHFPQMEKFMNHLPYKSPNKSNIKKELKNISNKDEITHKLASIFDLNQKIDQIFMKKFFLDASGISVTKSNRKSAKVVFWCGMRAFIILTYQITEIIDNALIDDSYDDLLSSFNSIPLFFAQFNDKNFTDFVTILGQFLFSLKSRFEKIFSEQTSITIKSSCFMFIGSLVSCAKVEELQRPKEQSMIISFIISNLGSIFDIIGPALWDDTFFANVSMIFSVFLSYFSLFTADQVKSISCSSIYVLNNLPENKSMPVHDLCNLGTICLQTYTQCIGSGKINKDLIDFQFPQLLNYCRWTTQHYPSKLKDDDMSTLQELPDISSLSKISVQEYFSRNDIIQYQVLHFNREVDILYEKVKQILNSLSEPNEYLCILVSSFSKRDNEAFTPETFRTYVIFVIQIIFSFKEEMLGVVFKDSWMDLLTPTIFPSECNVKYDRRLTDAALFIMLRCFIYEESCRTKILDTLAQYIVDQGEICFSYFIYLLNSLLLTDEKSGFGPVFSKSKLIKIILKLSSTKLIFFDFLRHFIIKNPSSAMKSSDIIQFICDSFMVENKTDSALACFSAGLKIGKDSKTCVFGLLQKLNVLLNKLIQNSDKRIILLFNTITEAISVIPVDFVADVLSKTFDLCSQIPILFQEHLNDCLRNFIAISKSSNNALEVITRADNKIYDHFQKILKNYIGQAETLQLLFSLATLDKTFFANPLAIELIFIYSELAPADLSIINKLIEMCSNSTESVFQMNAANASEHIINRFEQDSDEETIKTFLTLFEKIYADSFSSTIFYGFIRILKNPTFKYPHHILASLVNILKKNHGLNPPSSYFHFAGKSTGIFGPSLILGDAFSFIISFKIEDFKAATNKPLISFTPEKSCYLTFLFNGQHLRVQTLDVKGSNDYQFLTTFEPCKWYNLIIIFKEKDISLYVNGEFENTIPNLMPINFDKNKVAITIGSLTSNDKVNCLCSDIGPIFILKTTDFNTLKQIRDTVPQNLENLVMLSYLPKNTRHDDTLETQVEPVQYKGRSINVVNTIYATLSSPSNLPNMIPLLTRLNGCRECNPSEENENEKSFCEHCGALSIHDGVKYLKSFIQIFSELLKHPQESKQFNDLLLSIDAPQLIIEFLSQTKLDYFNRECISEFLFMFESITNKRLAVKFVDALWNNFDFLNLLKPNIQEDMLLISRTAFESNPEAFLNVSTSERFMYRVITNKFPNNISAIAWQFLGNVVAKSESKTFYYTFFSVPFSNVDLSITDYILATTLALLYANNQTIMQMLAHFGYFVPFIPLMSIKNHKIQVNALLCILQISENANGISIFDPLVQCAIAFNHTDNDNDLIMKINSLMVRNAKVVVPELFPLWSVVCKSLDPEIFIESLKSFDLSSITKVQFWYYWLFFNEVIPNDLFLPLIKKVDLYLLFDFLGAYSSETGIDLLNLKKEILRVQLKKRTNEQRLKMVFRYLFFTKVIITPKELNNSLDTFLKTKLKLFSEKANCVSLFHLNIDNDGNWKDLDIAKEVISHANPSSNFVLKFSERLSIHSFSIYAYIAHTISLFDKNAIDVESIFKPILDTADIVTAYQAASILAINNKMPFLDQYLEIYTDDIDSPRYQLFLFEDHLAAALKENSFIKILHDTVKKNIKSAVPSKEIEDNTTLSAYCSFSNPQAYTPFLNTYSSYKARQILEMQNEKVERNHLFTNFMTRLQINCGPWSQEGAKMSYRLFNSTSRRGYRTLMVIDMKTTKSNTNNYLNERSHSIFGLRIHARRICVKDIYEGELSMIDEGLIYNGHSSNNDAIKTVINQMDIVFVIEKSLQHHPHSIEIYTFNNKTFLFSFENFDSKNSLLKALNSLKKHNDTFFSLKFNIFHILRKARPSLYPSITPAAFFQKSNLIEKWQNREISNFEYIYYINMIVGNSYNSVEQYPVFPCITGNSETIDYSLPSFYGVFPSYIKASPAKIVSLLIRIEPYTTISKTEFDESHINVVNDITENHFGVPELYTLPHFLININNIPGISDIKLPPWAKSASHYVGVLRRALESEFCSINLPKWLDSVFGNQNIFQVPHPKRFPLKPVNRPLSGNLSAISGNNLKTDDHAINLPRPVIRMKNQFIVCANNYLIDIRNEQVSTIPIPRTIVGTLMTTSRLFGYLVFGTKNDNFVNIFCLNKKQQEVTETIAVECGSIKCAAIIGDKYILLGTSDNSISIWRLKDFKHLSTTCFHTEPIISIGGNAELGLVVSVDRHFNIVFEVLLCEKFIRVVKMTQEIMIPFIEVFRSGNVAFVQPREEKSTVTLFDSRGEIIWSLDIDGKIIETDKYLANFSEEYLIVGLEKVGIEVIDILDKKVVRSYKDNGSTGMFCAVGKSKCIFGEVGQSVHYYPI
ncbi:hypothetical protein TRFO_34914 [Tritrichomonas foetus]|uniref:BEACH-type PH domain-containing protein n=1 Tax=Tritrichomonas foetus TaxID=1144522 RepID=A0A1J4JHM4_9EUKA|nr:hypothetical protein TRFO_34914 [Tritrichomonas foetus]|eukprot:OHS98638.1 hypothetical protein TRFO_34914 [Tritrichomonas foetus]